MIDVQTKHDNLFSILLLSEQKQARKLIQFIAVEVFIYLFTVFIFNYRPLFVCVKDRACLKLAITAYCFTTFGSIFGVLFCLLIKKLILGSKTIWQSMRKFLCGVWSVRTFLHVDKDEAFFFLENCTLVWSDFLR